MLLKGNSIAFESQPQSIYYSFRFHLIVKRIKKRKQMGDVGWKEVGKWFSFIREIERR
jgi:hypothetical protein